MSVDHRARSRLGLDQEAGMIAGVCAGLARSLGVEPTWVRVAALIVALLATKLAVVAYLVAWLVLDDERKLRPDR